MTPKKEIYLHLRAKLAQLAQLEYIDLNRGQYQAGKDNYPPYYTACLISFASIVWETMVEQGQLGTATVEIMLYTYEGFTDQYAGTADEEDGLAQINLIDQVVDALQGSKGTSFRHFQQTEEASTDSGIEGLMAYRLVFEALVCRQTSPRHSLQNNPLLGTGIQNMIIERNFDIA